MRLKLNPRGLVIAITVVLLLLPQLHTFVACWSCGSSGSQLVDKAPDSFSSLAAGTVSPGIRKARQQAEASGSVPAQFLYILQPTIMLS